MNVLGIETSCDETAAAVVRDGRDVLSNVIFSQVALHRPYGGVVPEVASRSHVEALPGVLAQAVADAGIGWPEVDAVAVTCGPGLATSLLVGLSAAKALALRLERPLIGINHLEAHIHSVFLKQTPEFIREHLPMLCLVVSGGHTCLVRVPEPGSYAVLGQTIDDAAGEAFDKAANLLQLGYPGGPAIDRIARTGNPKAIDFPRGTQRKPFGQGSGYDPRLCFTFSGLKTALLYHLKRSPPTGLEPVADIAASYQEAVVDALVKRLQRAYSGERSVAIMGGVSLNSRLRARLAEVGATLGARVAMAGREFCADNAAMIAGLAGAGFGVRGPMAMRLDVYPSLAIAEDPLAAAP